MDEWLNRWTVGRKDLLLEKRKAGKEDRRAELRYKMQLFC